jgi:hypothetical protein
MKVTEFIKFRRLQWVRHIIRMEEHRIPTKTPQQTIHCKIRVGNSRKRCEDEVREEAVQLFGVRAWKTKAEDTESWRQRKREAKARYGL